MPHSSLEVGAFGSSLSSYDNWIKAVLEDVIKMLIQHYDFKFNWSDVAYLEMWWHDRKVSSGLKGQLK